MRQLLDLWVKQGRISADVAKPVHQQMLVFERQAAAASQLNSLGVPPGIPVQRVILTAHEEPLDMEKATDRALVAPQDEPAADAAAGAAAAGAAAKQGAAGVKGAPGSPEEEEGLLAALVEDDVEEGEVVLPAEQQQQPPEEQKQQPGLVQGLALQPQQQDLLYKNLFGPKTVRGYVLKQYNCMDHFCQLPLVSVIAQHLGKQAAATAAAAAAAKQSSSGRTGGLLAVLQQRGLELRWSPEVLSARSEGWLLEDHEQVRVFVPGWQKCSHLRKDWLDVRDSCHPVCLTLHMTGAAGLQ